jgi:endoglucanase Acf2
MNLYQLGLLAGLTALSAAAIPAATRNSAIAADGGGVVQVDAGSYTTKLPPGAKYPSYTQYKTENVKGPVPLSQWWSALLCWPLDKGSPLYGHPLGIRYDTKGLRVYYPGPRIHSNNVAIWAQMWDDTTDIRLGLAGVDSFSETRVDAFSDWFISAVSKGNDKSLRTSYGHGSPFIYATAEGAGGAVSLVGWPKVFSGGADDAVLGITVNGHHYGIFGPTGSKWTGLDKFPEITAAEREAFEKKVFDEPDAKNKIVPPSFTLANNLNGKKYFSVALLPDDKPATLALYRRYAYNFVTDTKVAWKYESPGVMKTTFSYTVEPQEGTGTETVFALYPHQWKYTKSPLQDLSYASVRGTMKVGVGSSFVTAIPIQGVLPVFPKETAVDKEAIATAVKAEAKTGRPVPLDTYDEGKILGKLALLSAEAETVGDLQSQKVFIDELKKRLENWFTAKEGKASPIFYYDANFGSMIGYRASFGSDVNLNDHHFHYGYFIRAAAEIARVDPQWAEKWGGMVKLLIRDIATTSRDDKMFAPFRCFDRYAGHCWASGDGHAIDGCNQESSSESMNAWYAVMLWGQATGDIATRDLGLYIYSTEMTAIEEYWFDVSGTNYPKDFPNVALGMVWGGKGAFGTWFSADIDCIHGINWMPFTPGSVYLGRYPEYVKKNFARTVEKRGGGKNFNSGWGDLVLMFHATQDPVDAAKHIAENKQTKFENGNSSAFFLHWIGTFDTYGQIDRTVTADHPMHSVFSKNGVKTYMVYNFTDKPLSVAFSDGVTIQAATKGLTVRQGK